MLYRSYLLVHTLAFTVLLRNVHGAITNGIVLENFEAGVCKRGKDDVILFNTSYAECIEECRARSECLSVSVLTRGSLCRLNFVGEDEKKMCNFYAYSEKNRWEQKTKEGCEPVTCTTNQRCELSGGRTACINRECRRITSIDNGDVTGNDVRKGMKISFRCNTGYRLIGSSTLMCGEDGEWSDTEPTCSDSDPSPGSDSTQTPDPPPVTVDPPPGTDPTQTPAPTPDTVDPPPGTDPTETQSQTPAPGHTSTTTVQPDTPSTFASYNEACGVEGAKQCSPIYLECRDGLCRCAFGRRFNPLSYLSCTYVCNVNTDMGTSFQTHANKWMNGVDDYLLKTDVDTGTCTARCTQMPDCSFAMVATGDFGGVPSCSLYKGNPYTHWTIVDAKYKSVHFRDCGLTEQVDPPDTSTSTTTQTPDSTTTSPDDTINTTTEPEVDSGYSASCSPLKSTDCRHTYLTCRDDYCGCVFGRVYDPTTRSCVTMCDEYGTTFQKHSSTSIASIWNAILIRAEVLLNDIPSCLETCQQMTQCNMM